MTGSPDPSRFLDSPAHPLSAYPNVYEAAFGWDRVPEARDFLRVARASLHRPPRAMAELACGTGVLARHWARAGIPTVGLDRNPRYLMYAEGEARREALPVEWVLGDLADLALPNPVDVAVVPMDGLTYLTREEEFRSFFQGVAEALSPDGCLLLDLSLVPPGDPAPRFRHRWTVHLRPAGRLRVEWRSWGRAHGPLRQRWEVGRMVQELKGRPSALFAEVERHVILAPEDLLRWGVREGPFHAMRVRDAPAHRSPGEVGRVLRGLPRRTGTYLVCFDLRPDR